MQCGIHTWSKIIHNRGTPSRIQTLLHVANILEEHSINLIHLCHLKNYSLPPNTPQILKDYYHSLQEFYLQPEIELKSSRHTISLLQQLCQPVQPAQPKQSENFYSYLEPIEESINSTIPATMSTNTNTNSPRSQPISPATQLYNKSQQYWVNDTKISVLSKQIQEQLTVDAQKKVDAGEEDANHTQQYVIHSDNITTTIPVNQRLRFNNIHHRNSVNSTTTLQLFKSFALALRASDQFLAILPFQAGKQDISSLTNIKQINAVNENKLQVYFKSYFKRQMYSLSGYLHISSSLSFEQLIASKDVHEWLECNRYSVKLSPSQEEEMVSIGALSFSSEFIYREDLCQSIQQHPSWNFPSFPTPPIIELTKVDFRSSTKNTKMVFVSTEKSKQLLVANFFSSLYDATPKEYPNGIMLLFIPLRDGIVYDDDYRNKIIYNHEQYLGNESAISIMGLGDLNTMIALTNGTTVSIRTLIKSLPASHGMCRPQLFQHVEQNSSGGITLATFQECDRAYIQDRKMTLERELRCLLAQGEDEKLFQSSADGLWFDNIHKNKRGHIINSKLASKTDIEHIQHTKMILSSPPKQRPNGTVSNSSKTTNAGTNPQPMVIKPVTCLQTNSYSQQIDDQKMQLIHERFVTVESEFKLQNERNVVFDRRISSLETTTQRSDMKLDIMLRKLEQWDDTTPAKQRKIDIEYSDLSMGEATLPQASSYNKYAGSMEP